jgi:hypothetical protein
VDDSRKTLAACVATLQADIDAARAAALAAGSYWEEPEVGILVLAYKRREKLAELPTDLMKSRSAPAVVWEFDFDRSKARTGADLARQQACRPGCHAVGRALPLGPAAQSFVSLKPYNPGPQTLEAPEGNPSPWIV